MSRPLRMLTVLAGLFAALLLASCSKPDNGYQGWIEANLIFVAPDEVGRVQTLSVREGDTVKTGDPLFTVDDDLARFVDRTAERLRKRDVRHEYIAAGDAVAVERRLLLAAPDRHALDTAIAMRLSDDAAGPVMHAREAARHSNGLPQLRRLAKQ